MHALGRNRQPSTINTNLDSYDNKVVSSTLVNSSANEPISPISSVFSSSAQSHSATSHPFASSNLGNNPSNTHNNVGLGVNHLLHHSSSTASSIYNAHPSHPYSNNALPSGSSGRTFSRSGGIGGSSSAIAGLGSTLGSTRNLGGSSLHNDSHPSHPSSPWSVVTLTVLPVFNGTPLLTPIEDLNALVSSHITSSIARSPQAYRSLLSSDLQELISSGMLTIKAKLDPVLNEKEGLLALNPGKVLGRVAEVWGFFFSIVPYLQGIFLPLTLLTRSKDASSVPRHYSTTNQEPDNDPSRLITTDVRHLLLSGFLIHILLPILPKLLVALEIDQYGPGVGSTSETPNDQSTKPGPSPSGRGRTSSTPAQDQTESATNLNSPGSTYPAPPTQDQLGRLQHMALIVSTQAKRSSCFAMAVERDHPRPRSRDPDHDEDSDDSDMDNDGDLDEEEQTEYDRERVEDLLRAIVAFKNGGRDVTSNDRMLIRGSNAVGAGLGMMSPSVPRPRRRGYFSGVALGGSKPRDASQSRSAQTRYQSGASTRGPSRNRDRAYSETKSATTMESSGEEDELGRSIPSGPSSRVSEFGMSLAGQGSDQTPTVTDLGRRVGRLGLGTEGEDTVRPTR